MIVLSKEQQDRMTALIHAYHPKRIEHIELDIHAVDAVRLKLSILPDEGLVRELLKIVGNVTD